MVTIAEARARVQARRQEIAQARLRQQTALQLRTRTRADIERRKLQAKQLGAQKARAEAELIPFEAEITRVETAQQARAQARRELESDIKVARNLASKNIVPFGASERVLDLFRTFRQEFSAGEERAKQLRSFTEAGLKPIFVAGSLTGFEDVIGKQSIPIENLGLIGGSRLETLEEGGAITFTKIPLTEKVDIPDFTPLPTKPGVKEELSNFLFRGGDLIGIGLPGQPPLITTSEINVELRKLGLPGKVIAGFIPETPAETIVAGVVVGLASSAGLTGLISRGVITGLGTATALSPGLSTEERIAGGVVAIAPLIPFLAKSGFKIKGKKGESAFAQSSFDELGQFFKKKNKKSDLQNALDDFSFRITRRQEGKILRDTTDLEKLTLIRKSFDKILETKDPKLRKAQTEGFVKLLKIELGEQKTNSLITEFLNQEGLRFQQQGGVGTSVLTSIRAETSKRFIIPVVKIDQTAFNRQRIERAQMPIKERFEIAQKDLLKKQDLTKNIQEQQKRISSLMKQRASQKILLKERQKLRLLVLQRQNVGQAGRQRQVQRQIQRQRQLLRQKQILQQRQVSRQKLKKLLRPGLKFRPRIRKLPLLPGVPKKKKKVQRIPTEFEGFQVFTRRKGKDIPRKLFKTERGARKGLRKRLDRTLGASGFVKNLRTGKRLVPKPSRNFRISKVDPLRLVEKRGRRLSTGSEVSEIKEAKRLSKPFKKRVK